MDITVKSSLWLAQQFYNMKSNAFLLRLSFLCLVLKKSIRLGHLSRAVSMACICSVYDQLTQVLPCQTRFGST